MTLLGMDGFDHKSSVPRPGSNIVVGNSGFGAGRFGTGGSWRFGSTGQSSYSHAVTPQTGTFIMGYAYYTNGGGNQTIIEIQGGGAGHLAVGVNASRGYDLYRGYGGATIASSAPALYTLNTWVYIEIKCTIADTGGIAVVRVNGVEVINYTGDTRNGGSAAQIDNISIRYLSAFGPDCGVDDWYWANASGAAPYNDFLGDVKIETVVPNGPGASSQWTSSSGQNWTCVDEVPASMTDYVQSGTTGQRDSYAMSDLVTTVGNVLAVRPLSMAIKTDAGIAAVRVNTRTAGGTVRQGSSQPLSSTPVWYLGDMQTVDPDGNGWNINSVNTTEFGVEVG